MTLRSLKFLAAATFFVPLAAHAMDDTPSADRILTDPLYLPLQGQFYGDTSYQWATTSQDVFNSSGAQTASQRIDSNMINQSMEYGVTDDLALRMGIGYDPSVTTKTSPVGGSSFSRTSEGWTDPQFEMVYRALDQRTEPVTFDLRGTYSPDAFKAKSATDLNDGSVGRGGQYVDLGATLGREMRGFTVAGLFDAQYYSRRSVENEQTGFNVDTSSDWQYSLGLATQTRFTNQLSLNAGAGYQFGHNANVFNEATSVAHSTTVRGTPNLNAALNYHFVPNAVVGSLTYQHNFTTGTDNDFAVAANDTQIHNHGQDILGVRLRYVLQ